MVLNDWQRGRIPFFVKPPGPEGDQDVRGFFCCLFFFRKCLSTLTCALCSQCFVFLLDLFQDKQPLAVEGPSEVVENAQEEQADNPDGISEEQQQRQKEQVQKIVANVRQNFGKIYVAPEFNEEDLVPVEMPDLDMSDFSGSDGEEESEEEESAEGERARVEPADGETEESEPTTAQTGKANGNKSSHEVIRELDEKISKYKQFLDRAKSKRFSAIRFVFSHPNLTRIFFLCFVDCCNFIQ